MRWPARAAGLLRQEVMQHAIPTWRGHPTTGLADPKVEVERQRQLSPSSRPDLVLLMSHHR